MAKGDGCCSSGSLSGSTCARASEGVSASASETLGHCAALPVTSRLRSSGANTRVGLAGFVAARRPLRGGEVGRGGARRGGGEHERECNGDIEARARHEQFLSSTRK